MRGVADVDRLHIASRSMDDGINPFEYRDVDCSGRSLATLMVAWVGAAMVASVLLRWKYMWIALMVLTLLFLFACGYAACNTRRAHERVIASEEARILERRRRDRNIQSVSGAVDNCAEITDPPAYQAYWITDLPPPYAVVIGAQSSSPPLPPPMPRSPDTEPTTPTSGYSNPPPYSVAIQSDPNDTSQTSNQALRIIANRVGTSSSDRRNTSFDEPTNSRMERVVTASNVAWDDDVKIASEQTVNEGENSLNNPPTVLTTGTRYLNNIISCTIGRGQRLSNVERNGNLQTTTPTTMTTMSDRLDISQLNNQNNTTSANRISASTL